MIFSWLKLGLGLMTLFVCLAIGAVAWLIITKMAFDTLTSIAIGCTAFLIAIAIYFLMMSKLGYSIKLGHLAIIERAHNGENVPPNPVEFSKTVIKERFGSNRQYYALSRDILITKAQLIRVISRGFSLESDIPDLQTGRWFKHLICTPALTCIDECCLSYALSQKTLEVNAASVDALTILVQGWPTFIRKATKLSVLHLATCLLTFALFFVPGFFICRDLGINTLPWIGVSFFLMLTVKIAIYDSYVLTKIVCEFLNLAADMKIEPKNYPKLDKWSKGYAKLRNAAEKAADKAEDEADKAERAARKEAKKAEKAAKKAKALPAEVESNEAKSDEAASSENTSNEAPDSEAESTPTEAESTSETEPAPSEAESTETTAETPSEEDSTPAESSTAEPLDK